MGHGGSRQGVPGQSIELHIGLHSQDDESPY